MMRWKWMLGFLYQTIDGGGGESKTAERQKERECERQSIAGSEG
jgi:hypothetical protein